MLHKKFGFLGKSGIWVIFIVVLVLIALGGYFGYKKYYSMKNTTITRQAVFLTNGQVYFGFIANQNSDFVTVNNVYYLQSVDQLQSSNTSKVLLIKPGNELHGPTNVIYINRSQILYYQDMKSDSKINQAIAASEGK